VPSNSRVYAGVDAAQRSAERRLRFLASGLDLLGTAGLAALTVRGVAAHAGLAARYFYESFPDVDALAVAVFDGIADELVQAGKVALADEGLTDLRDGVRAALGAAIGLVADDPRKGRVLLMLSMASPALARRRLQLGDRVAVLVADQFRRHRPAGPAPTDRQLRAMSRFMVGGFAEILTVWMRDPQGLTRDEVLDDGVELFLAVASAVRVRT